MKIFRFHIKKRVAIPLALLLLFGGYQVYSSQTAPKIIYNTAQVGRGDVTAFVRELGTIKAIDVRELGFKRPGKVRKIHVIEGQKIGTGAVIAELESSDISLQIAQAEEKVRQARANLDTLLSGAKREEVSVQDVSIKNAQTELKNTKEQLQDTKENEQANIHVAELEVEAADKNVLAAREELSTLEVSRDNAQKTINDLSKLVDTTLTNRDTSINAQYLKVVNALGVSATQAVSALRAADNILGVDVSIANEGFKSNLGANYPQSVQTASAQYSATKTSCNAARESSVKLTNTSTIAQIQDAYNQMVNCLRGNIELLTSVRVVLDNTTTSYGSTDYGFTIAKLDALKTSTQTALLTISTQKDTLESAFEAVKTIQSNQGVSIDSASNQVESAKRTLDSLNAQRDSILKKVDIAEANANTARGRLEAQKSKSQTQINTTMRNISSLEGKVQQATKQKDLTNANPRASEITLRESQIDDASKAVEILKRQLDDYRIVSDFSGVVTDVKFKAGEIYTSGGVATITSPDWYVEVPVYEEDIPKIMLADKAIVISDALDGVEFTAKVHKISEKTIVKDTINYYNVELIMDQPAKLKESGLRLGMRAYGKIVIEEKPQVLVIPSNSVKKVDGKIYVSLPPSSPKDKPTDVEVTLGIATADIIEVLSGVTEGQSIIIPTAIAH